jgi:hypothetical protein
MRLPSPTATTHAVIVYGIGVIAPTSVTRSVLDESIEIRLWNCSSILLVIIASSRPKKYRAIINAQTPPRTEVTSVTKTTNAARLRLAKIHATMNGSVIIGTGNSDSTNETIPTSHKPDFEPISLCARVTVLVFRTFSTWVSSVFGSIIN